MKKKQLINKKFRQYCTYLFNKKIFYYKILGETSYETSYMININKQYNSIIKLISKNNLLNNHCIMPSILKICHDNGLIKPFWNNDIQKLSDKLYMPSIDNLHLVQKLPKAFNTNTWFNTKCYKSTNVKPYHLISKEINKTQDLVTKSRQVKLYMNKQQKMYMSQIIGTYRYYYNRCVSYLNNYDKLTKTSWFLVDYKDKNSKVDIKVDDNAYNFMKLRPFLKQSPPNWLLKDFPSHLIDQAFKECFSRFNTCLSNYQKTKKPFTFKYKTKKDIIQTINLEKQMINVKTNGLFTNWKLNSKYLFRKIKMNENLCKYDLLDSSLTYQTILKTYTLNIPYKVQSNPTTSKNICAIDQGIRKPFTIYSPTNVTIIGTNVKDKIYKVCKEIDIIRSRMSKESYYVNSEAFLMGQKIYNVTSKRKRNLRKALHRRIKYLKNLKKELHNKCIRYLCDTYKTIILPPFKTQDMAGNLHSKVARNMYTLSFYEFRMKLINKAKEYNINVKLLNEPYTSKTCGKCGSLNYSLGNSETFKCPKCNLEIDRDINGARCIMLRNINYC